ncbi:MAG: ABC transporter substrate-binding protein [Actinomycetota bacterium]|nr:ABC transporter substrate-binding protein [Actinomycetota bacterium]
MRARRQTTSILLAGALLFSACTSGDPAGGGGDGGNGAEGGGGGTVSVAAVWTGTEQENFQAVLDAFTEQTDIDTEYQSNADIGTFLGTQIEGGEPPDVALLPQPGLLRDFAGQDALVEVNQEAASAVEENYAPVWADLATVDGTLYGVYFKAANKSTWWYNTQAFSDAGVQPPEDWDEMLQQAGTVAQSGVPYLSLAGGDAWPLTDLFENVYLRTAGPEKYDQLANHEIKWTDQSVIDALEVMGEILEDDANLAGGKKGTLQTDFPTSVSQVFTDPPEAATVFEGDFVAGVIAGETEAKVGEDADYFPFPSIDGSPAAVVAGGDVAVALTDSEEAQELLTFLASPEAAEAWAERGGFASPNQGVDTGVYPDEVSQRIAEDIVNAQDLRFDMSDLQPAAFGATAGRGMWLRFQEFVQTLDAQQTAQDLERDAAKAFK